ncbi:MAG: hypothetical protein AAGJ28_04565 [Pseudomonadota bacterium]
MSKEYPVNPTAHLERAVQCLQKNTAPHLFYAAFEIRCCVELRQNEYLEAQEEYRSSLPKRFRIGQQAKELAKIYSESRIQKITMQFNDGFSIEFCYVPVSNSLKANTERLGSLLHSQHTELSTNRLAQIRSHLRKMIQAVEECLSGNCLSPSLIDGRSGQPVSTVKALIDPALVEDVRERILPGNEMKAHVEYVPIQHDLTLSF